VHYARSQYRVNARVLEGKILCGNKVVESFPLKSHFVFSVAGLRSVIRENYFAGK